MEVDRFKEQALVTWVNAIVQSKDSEIRIHGLEDVLEKRCLSILNNLLQIPFLQQESEETNPLKELFQYVDGFYKNAISSQKLVDFELLQTTRKTKNLRVEWCKFLLLLLAAAVQDRGREAFVTPATILASFLQLNIKDMLEVIINADQVPADFAAILFKSSKLEAMQSNEESTPLRRSRIMSSLSELSLQSPASPLGAFIQSPQFSQKITQRVLDNEAALKKRIVELEAKVKDLTRNLQMETDVGVDLTEEMKTREKIIEEKDADIRHLQLRLKENIKNTCLCEDAGALHEKIRLLEEERDRYMARAQECARYKTSFEDGEIYIRQQEQTIALKSEEIKRVQRKMRREGQAELEARDRRIAELQQECENSAKEKANVEEKYEKMMKQFESYRAAQEERRVETDESFVMEGETMSVVIDKQIGELHIENERLKAQIEGLRQEMEGCRNRLEREAQHSSQQIHSLQSQLTEEEEKTARAQSELEEKVERMQSLKDRVALAEHLAESHKERNTTLNADLSHCDAALVQTRNLLAQREKEVSAVTEALSQSREQCELQKRELEQELSSWREKAETSSQKASSVLEEKQQVDAELRARSEEVTALQEKVSSLQKALASKTAHAQTVQEQVAFLETDLGSKSAELKSLFTQLSSAVVEIGAKTSLLEYLQSRVSAAESELCCKATKVESLEGDVKSLETEVGARTAQVDSLVCKVSSLEMELGTKTALLEDLQNQVSLLQTEVEAKSTKLENLDSQVSLLETELCTKTTQVEDLQSQVRCLESELSSKTAQLESLQDQVSSAEAEIADRAFRGETLTSQVNTLQSELEARVVELKSVMIEKGVVEVSLQNAQAQKEALQSKVESLKEQLHNEVDRARREKQEAEVLHQADLEERHSAEKALQERVTAVEAQLEEERTSHTAQLEALTRTGASQQEKQSAMEAQWKSENSHLKSELEQRTRSKDAMQSEVSKLDARVREMITSHYEELEKERRTTGSRDAEISALKSSCEEARVASEGEHQERVRLETALQEKEAELERLRNELEKQSRMETTLKTKLDETEMERSCKEETIQELQKEVVMLKELWERTEAQHRQEQAQAAARVLEAFRPIENVFRSSPLEQAAAADSSSSPDFSAQVQLWCERLWQFAADAQSQTAEEAALREQVQQSSRELLQTHGELASCRQELGRVEAHSKELQEQVQQSSRELVQTHGELASCRQELGRVEAHSKELQEQVQQSSRELVQTHGELASCRQELGRVEAHSKELQEQVQQSSRELVQTHGELASCRQELGRVEAHSKELQEQVQQSSRELMQTHGELASCRQELGRVEAHSKELQEQVQALRDRLATEARQQEVAIQEQASRLEETLQTLSQTVHNHSKEKVDMQLSWEERQMRQQEKFNTACKAYEKVQAEQCTLYEARLEEMRKDFEEQLLSQRSDFENQLSALRNELEEMQRERDQLDEDAATLRKLAEAEERRLREELSSVPAKKQDQTGRVGELTQEMASLASQLQQSQQPQAQLHQSQQALAQLRQQLEEKEGDVEAWKGKVAQLRQELDSKTDKMEQERQAWQAERGRLLQAKEKVEADNERWKETVQEQREEVSSWEQMYSKSRTAQEEMQELWNTEKERAVQGKEKEMLAERNVLEAKLIRQKNLMQTLKEDKQSLEASEERWKEEIQSVEERNSQLHAKIASMKEENVVLERLLEADQAECANLRNRLSCVSQKSDRQWQELESLRQEMEAKDMRLRKYKSRLDELRQREWKLARDNEQESARAAQYHDAVSSKLHSAVSQRDQAAADNKELEAKNRELKGLLQELRKDNKELEAENRELKCLLEKLRKDNKKLGQKVQRSQEDQHAWNQRSKELDREVEELRQLLDNADKRIADYKDQLEAAGTALLGNTHANLEAISHREELDDSLQSGSDSLIMSGHESSGSNLLPDTPDLCFIQSPESRSSIGSSSVFSQNNAFSLGSVLRRQVPVKLRGAFTCEDEPPEFEWDRVSELTRRNTIVRPHLQSSYPIETQVMNLSAHTEEDMRHGRLSEAAHRPAQKRKNDDAMMVEQGPPRTMARPSSSETGNSHHGKRACMYHRPGPPTPGSSSSRQRSLSTQSGHRGHESAHLAKTLSSPCFDQENSCDGRPPGSENSSRRESVAFEVGFSDTNLRRLTRQNAFIQGRGQNSKMQALQGMPPPASAPKGARKPLASRNPKVDGP